MSGMGAIGAAASVGLLSCAGAAGGITLATVGTLGFKKLSSFFAKKEHAHPQTSWQASACKVAKWAFLALSGLAGTSGAVLAGASIFAAVQIFSLGTLTPIAVAVTAGIISALLLEAFVVKKVIEQKKFLSKSMIQAG